MAATIRKFVTIKPKFGSDDLGKQFKSQMFAFNRLGVVLTDIGLLTKDFKEVVTTYTDSVTAFQEREREVTEKEHKHKVDIIEAQEDMLGKKKGLQQDKLAEEKQEGLSEKKEEQIGEGEAKKEKKSKFGWLKNLFSPMKMLMGGLIKLVAPFLALGVLDWLSKPENLEKIKTLLKFFKGIWDLARWFTKWGMTQVLDGLTKVFGNDPDKNAVENGLDKVFGVLQIVAGLASIFVGSRILMPWKLIGDFKAMRKLGEAFRRGTQPQRGGNGADGGGRNRNRNRSQRVQDRYRRRFGDRAANRRFGRRGGRRGLAGGLLGGLCPNPLDLLPDGVDDATKKAVAQNADDVAKKTGVEIAEQSSKKVATEAAEEVATSKGVMGALGDLFGRGQRLAGRAVDATVTGAKAVGSFTVGAFQNLNKWFAEGGERLIGGVKSLGQGIWDFGAKAGKAIGDIAELAKNPAALRDKAMAKVKDFVGPLLEKNPIGKQIKDLANAPPKGPLGGIKMDKIKDSIGGALKAGFQNPGFKNMREFLKAAKANAKIGGIDKIVALVMALMDYGMFGESPINALLKATGGLLGYSAGFAIGAPFGGVPGFITGMAGGFAGEWAAEQLLKLLYKIPWLAETDDPIAKMIGGDFAQRKLIRDPEGGFPGEDALMSAAESGDPGEPTEIPQLAMGGKVGNMEKKKRVTRGGMGEPTNPMFYRKIEAKNNEKKSDLKMAAGGLLATNGAVADVRLTPSTPFSQYPLHHNKPDTHSYNNNRLGGHPILPRDYVAVRDFGNQGLDRGTPVVAGVDGKVVHASGYTVVIAKNGKDRMQFHHFDQIKTSVGATVTPKSIIGLQGNKPSGSVHIHLDATPSDHRAFAAAQLGGDFDASTMTESESSGSDSGNQNTGNTGGGTDSDGGGGGVDATTEYLSVEKMTEALSSKLGILSQYASDGMQMGGGSPSSGVMSLGGSTTVSSDSGSTTTTSPLTGSATTNAQTAASDPPGALAPGQRPDKALTTEQWKVQQQAIKEAEQQGLEGEARAKYIAGRVMGTTAAPDVSETQQLNTKVEKLSTLSVDKTRREKEPKTNSLMVAVQPVVQTQVMGGGKKQSAGGPSASPLLNG